MGGRLGNLRVASKSRGCPHTSFWRLDKEHGFENANFGPASFEWHLPESIKNFFCDNNSNNRTFVNGAHLLKGRWRPNLEVG